MRAERFDPTHYVDYLPGERRPISADLYADTLPPGDDDVADEAAVADRSDYIEDPDEGDEY